MGPTSAPQTSKRLVEQLEGISNHFALSWLEHIEDVSLIHLGMATVAIAPSRPDLDFVNSIYGMPDSLEEALAPYRAAGVRPWVEVPPGRPEFERKLEAAGLERFINHTIVMGPAEAPAPELEVEAGNALLCAETFVKAVGAPIQDVASIKQWPGKLYIAFVDGEPAGAAALTIHGTLGHLANVATIPEFRGRGVQTALIRQRIRDAATAGCTQIVSGSSNEISKRNLERAGLREIYRNTVWRGAAI